jgi:hypothetical protein
MRCCCCIVITPSDTYNAILLSEDGREKIRESVCVDQRCGWLISLIGSLLSALCYKPLGALRSLRGRAASSGTRHHTLLSHVPWANGTFEGDT